jgi:hypothetical protein
MSAQFPGPSAPRDFVTLLMTSDTALGKEAPRHFMVVSKPCDHPEYQPTNGFVRGQYESVELIREIPRSKKSNLDASPATDWSIKSRKSLDDTTPLSPGRARGRTIGFAESRGAEAKGESIDRKNLEEGPDPVEWIMVTRSDPGGSVPRWMVERGTPNGIVTDASKFLDWACNRDLSESGTNKEDTDENTTSNHNKGSYVHTPQSKAKDCST